MNKPKPSEIRELEGNRGHRPIPEVVKPKPIFPRPSRWLLKTAKKEWRRLVPELHCLGLLTVIDIAALEGYCQCYARWKDAEAKVKIEVLETEKGFQYPNPYISIAMKYSKELRAYLTEFGMTPSARTKVGNPKKSNDDDWEGVLKIAR